jgi:hypothetical protein
MTQQKEGEADIESQWSFLGQGVLGGQRFLVPQYEAPAQYTLAQEAQETAPNTQKLKAS